MQAAQASGELDERVAGVLGRGCAVRHGSTAEDGVGVEPPQFGVTAPAMEGHCNAAAVGRCAWRQARVIGEAEAGLLARLLALQGRGQRLMRERWQRRKYAGKAAAAPAPPLARSMGSSAGPGQG